MKRRKLPPDTRPDWRDPEMPVWRGYVMANGSRKDWVDQDYEHRFREHRMQMIQTDPRVPSWRDDPTYNLRRKR